MNYKTCINYNILKENYQLKLPLELDYLIPVDDSVRTVSRVIDSIDLYELEKTYSRKSSIPVSTMLKIVIYASMNRIYSSRDIEKACKRDINFMYLLGGASVPDHSTIARFRTNHFSIVSKEIMNKINCILLDVGEINGETLYIDGTKIESAANRYTFVWKKTVNKNFKKLMDKISDFVKKCEELFEIKVVYNNEIKIKHLKKLFKRLKKLSIDKEIEFVHGKGRRKTQIQKCIETLSSYIDRLKTYNKHLMKLGNRNSYSKTDNDATFMRMKEDHMKNGQLKPAYNLEIAVDSAYITWVEIFSNPTDVGTLIPFLDSLDSNTTFKYKNIVADAGYESEENYLYLKKKGKISYIKTSNYEIRKTRKYKNDPGLAENMIYVPEDDYYICKDGRKLTFEKEYKRKASFDYYKNISVYSCNDCSHCEYKRSCIRYFKSDINFDDRIKRLHISKTFTSERAENIERITSEKGIELRINRSIQVEGAFAQIKNNMGFRRFLSKGKNNVLSECIIVALAHNINKLHRKIANL
ncbi:IS1182 family transposase [Peptacetobacter hominis]|uniref:IS1182 family transposase n=1 Tax=Peptacetobacter hominis TaxID=2743610 RepID=A0A544QSW9_9FIRM|nr:IS1182 family transposase [Peptacetobacter hominis]TQQ83131.1 IS1182 family transposase [Peptacetobacter hominis]